MSQDPEEKLLQAFGANGHEVSCDASEFEEMDDETYKRIDKLMKEYYESNK